MTVIELCVPFTSVICFLSPFLNVCVLAAFVAIPRDRIADLIRSQLGLTASQLTLAQVLDGATWKGGREIAKLKRPETGGPPIEIESDGTVF